jgi:DNA-cytosine methyltransferase
MKVLSLFDGMSCLQLSLKKLGVKVDTYYAAEINKYAIYVTMANFPNTIQLGDVTKIKGSDLGHIDFLGGGSPCQGFSRAGKGLNFEDERSKLFFEYVRILNELREINPNIVFLLENVDMDKWCLGIISKHLGVFPVKINSALVCAQNRVRWYWSNIRTRKEGFWDEIHTDIPQPKDRGILLKDILQPESEIDAKYYMSDKILQRLNQDNVGFVGFKNEGKDSEKSAPLLARDYKGMSNQGLNIVKIAKDGTIKGNQDKASCFCGGNHSGGNHSDMDLLMIKGNYIEWGNGYSQDNMPYYPKSKSGCVDSKSERQKVMQINPSKESNGQQPFQQNRIYSTEGKAPHISSSLSTGSDKILSNFKIRRLTPIECERLQTVPDNYTVNVSDSQRYKMLGNGWTIDVICHILQFLTPSTIF